jgi:hypothetical protein
MFVDLNGNKRHRKFESDHLRPSPSPVMSAVFPKPDLQPWSKVACFCSHHHTSPARRERRAVPDATAVADTSYRHRALLSLP